MPPLSILIKPASGSCNMRCTYCFYTDETEKRATPLMGLMSQETMRTIVDKALRYAEGDCTFSFQGGEPTLAGLSFFQSLTDYVDAHPNPRRIRVHYSIQTNGYALDEDWAKWFSRYDVLVGISLDGPREIHDRYRRDHEGNGTFDRVMNSISLLKKHKVEFNVLTVVSSANAGHAAQMYNFFKRENLRYQQYIECLDPIGQTPGENPYSLTSKRYEMFLKNLFDCWYRDMKNGRYVYNRYFENLMMILTGQRPEACSLHGVCAPQWVIEADGSVYPCDFYALDQWQIGNILTDDFPALEENRRASGFIRHSARIYPDCKVCEVAMLCRGGCRRNREPVTADTTGKNYFCEAYRAFLPYALPRLKEIISMLMAAAGR